MGNRIVLKEEIKPHQGKKTTNQVTELIKQKIRQAQKKKSMKNVEDR